MIADWVYNRIENLIKREKNSMDLDTLLKEKIGHGAGLELVNTAPESVSLIDKSPFYIKPSLSSIDVPASQNSRVILFSAPGATGKSALAKYISYSSNALLWDLSKDRIANHSFTGMLVDSLGANKFSAFTEGLKSGSSVLVIDALEEAEMISGRVALETLLTDICSFVKDAVCANVVLCARTETAHFIKEFFKNEDSDFLVSHYEIGFFEDSSAINFLKKAISDKRNLTPATEQWIKEQFEEIKLLLGDDLYTVRSFLGYAPVLEALAVFFDEDAGVNTMQALQNISKKGESTAVFVSIMNYILDREQGKVSNGLKTRCEKEFPKFNEWNVVYKIDEQIIRLADYVSYGAIDYDSYQLLNLPHELSIEYKDCIESFLKDHPFVQSTDRSGNIGVDFTGAAFRDYILACLMIKDEYCYYATNYYKEHRHNVRFPSQLFFDFYCYYANGKMNAEHFQYLYDSFKAKERADTVSRIEIEEAENETYCSFYQQLLCDEKKKYSISLTMNITDKPIVLTQASNLYIDVTGDVMLGEGKEDVLISNSTIKCSHLIVNTPNIMIIGEAPSGTYLSCTKGLDATRCPNVRFDIRADKDHFKMIAPNVSQWYKLRSYECALDDTENIDVMKFEHSVRTILKYFRKHGKDAPGRHYEFIKNVIIGGSALKQSVLDFLIEQGIIYKDSKDLQQYKLDNDMLEKFGVNWGNISQNAIPEFKELFGKYLST